ncbi:MAG TPA: alpha/beta fold hydrolase [Candidatus Limnocylindria bacterium]|nr:alpha/beta fold hydrolase [Candidatus Limnocylindria bacterium]
MSALAGRPLLVFGLIVAIGIGVWVAATLLIERDPTFVRERACPESSFSCVTLNVPRDHSELGGETWEVTFAIQRALSGTRDGVLIYATGGPGTSGIAVAEDYTTYFDPEVPERYDIVFFDQRGIGLSQPLQCPKSSLVWYTTPEIPTGTAAEAEAFRAATEEYVVDCVTESGVDPGDLDLYATSQAVEDLEAFLTWHGADQVVLFGESYGTQYMQAYAGAHPERVAALLIDGPIDLTVDGHDYYAEATEASAAVLADVLGACTDDPACRADVAGGDALDAYDRLVEDLRDGPMSFDFVTADGAVERRSFGLNDLETAASSWLTPSTDRMFLQRAVAQASRGQLLPMARLLYGALGQDPETEDAVIDPTWSDALYFAVDCADYAFGSGTADARADAYFAAAEAAGVPDMRLGSGYFLDLPCAYWPAHGPGARPAYLGDTPYPVIILGSTWDPYTPYANAERLAAHLDNSHLITQPGGPHVISYRGEACPDELLDAFLLDGTLPDSRKVDCDFIGVDPYVPIPAASVDDYDSTVEALGAVDDEINHSPDWWYWDGVDPLTVGCLYGGHVSYFMASTGYEVEIDDCAFSRGLTLTGGAVIHEDFSFTMDVRTEEGSTLTYERTAAGDRTASGELP